MVHQVTVQTPFQIEVLFESGSFRERPNQLVGSVLTDELEKRKVAFDEKFESSFGLQAKGFTSSQIEFAKAALSNMLGGMGYFFGQSVVQSAYNEHPVLSTLRVRCLRQYHLALSFQGAFFFGRRISSASHQQMGHSVNTGGHCALARSYQCRGLDPNASKSWMMKLVAKYRLNLSCSTTKTLTRPHSSWPYKSYWNSWMLNQSRRLLKL